MKRILTTIGALMLVIAVTLPPGAFAQEGGADDSGLARMNAPSLQDRDTLGCEAALETYETMGCDGNCSDECRSVGLDLVQCQDIGNRDQVACTN
jgi:hypothetical protein